MIRAFRHKGLEKFFRSGHWAVWVDKNWRLTFSFENAHATAVNYLDYH